jgi:aspartyl protease family protein
MPPRLTSKIESSWIVAAVCVILLGLLAMFFSYLLDNLYNPNQQVISRTDISGNQEVVLIRNNTGHYVTSGKINGKPVVFLLDTGATNVSIPKLVAEKLKLKSGISVMVQTANGTISVKTTRLASVSVGNIEIQNVIANINPHTQGNEILLGMSFLRHLELVQLGDTLTLRPQ